VPQLGFDRYHAELGAEVVGDERLLAHWLEHSVFA
jgi:hypothetical protein